MLVVGDLHGDFYKLKRILEEKNIAKINEEEVEIIDEETKVIFIGDYVDWRGEELENPNDLPYNEIVKGTYRIIRVISKLIQERKNVFALIGNHEEMMLNGLKIINKVGIEEFNKILEKSSINPYSVLKEVAEKGLIQEYFSFYNWFSQGGMNTIKAFNNNIQELLDTIENAELFKNLLLFVYFETEDEDKVVISHSFPDDLQCIDRIIKDELTVNDVSLILWSRKIWGIDAFNGVKTAPLNFDDVSKKLDEHKIKRYIVGHTRLTNRPKPIEFIDGRIVNVDNHGIPMSEPFFDNQIKIKNYKLKKYSEVVKSENYSS